MIMKVKIEILLDHETDADILSYFGGMSTIQRNRFIKQRLRDYISGDLDTETIKTMIDEIRATVLDLYNSVKLAGHVGILEQKEDERLYPKYVYGAGPKNVDVIDNNDQITGLLKGIGI